MKVAICFGLAVVLLAGCGGGGGSNDNCPSMAGTWTVTEHCEAPVVGSQVVVTQFGCDITSVWDGSATFTGTIDESGNSTISGNPGGGPITCTGSVSGNTWTSYCESIDCDVVTNRT